VNCDWYILFRIKQALATIYFGLDLFILLYEIVCNDVFFVVIFRFEFLKMNATHEMLRLLWLLMFITSVFSVNSKHVSHDYTNEFAVEIDGDVTVAELVAGTYSLRLVRQVSDRTEWNLILLLK